MMQSDTRALVYGQMADRLERDPYGPDGAGRATVVNGRGFKTWQRFHKDEDVVWMELNGRMIGLTPWQAKVYDLARALVDKPATMRQMAATLGCSVSTVSRAMVKLMAWGLIGYMVGRGRYAGMVIFRMVQGDGFERFRQSAKAKVARWKKAAEERVSRLWINVAPYIFEEGKGSYSIKGHYYSSTITKDATLTAQLVADPWEVEPGA